MESFLFFFFYSSRENTAFLMLSPLLVSPSFLLSGRENVKPGFGQLECDSRRERGRENEVVRERPREREKERGEGGKERQKQGHGVSTYTAHCCVSEQSQRGRNGREGAGKRGGGGGGYSVCMTER